MTAELYRFLPKILGYLTAAFSGISAVLIWTFPPAEGLRTLDPLALKNTMVALLLAFGTAALLATVLSPARKWLLPKIAIFALAGFSNSAALGPEVTVPFQWTTSAIATVCALGVEVLTIVAFVDSVQERNAQQSTPSWGETP
ncbi:hypothetical protein [Arthrobacter sp. NA-172]|uniref:hypothetical protein n=1 Tax=Arthrobacter sp. NA-172 TaxID=3367524 RepID=UPI0037548E3D